VKKMTLALAIMLSFLVPSFVFAQPDQRSERYYVGIGAQFYKVDKNTVTYYSGGKEYSNKDGKLTGLIIFDRVLGDGPAHKAGIRAGDVIVEVTAIDDDLNFEDAKTLDGEGLLKRLSGGRVGDQLWLRMHKIDTDGNIIEKYEALVIKELIDRVSWVPFDLELGGASCSNDDCIEYDTKVSRDKTTGKFVYYFHFFNRSSEPVILKSILFNLLLNNTVSDTGSYLLKLNPMKTSTFILESEDFPITEAPSSIREFINASKNPEILKYFNENYLDISSPDHYYKDAKGELWLNTMGVRWYFFVPEGWYRIMWEDNERFWKR